MSASFFQQKGNVFLCDYKILDGVKANTINGKKQYVMAPLVLLHKTPDNQLMPIAIQVSESLCVWLDTTMLCFTYSNASKSKFQFDDNVIKTYAIPC